MQTIELCANCGNKVETMSFRGTGLCSDKCKKELGEDRSSVGTFMFLTEDEKKLVEAFRKKEGITIDGRRLSSKKVKYRG